MQLGMQRRDTRVHGRVRPIVISLSLTGRKTDPGASQAVYCSTEVVGRTVAMSGVSAPYTEESPGSIGYTAR